VSAAPRLRASVVAIGAVSPLGAGDDATDVTRAGEPARVAIQQDDALVSLGFARPFCARAPREVFEGAGAADRATVLLDRATDLALEALVAALPRALERRVGLVLGTSSGGMCTAEALFERRARGAADAAEVARGRDLFRAVRSREGGASPSAGSASCARPTSSRPARRHRSRSAWGCDGSRRATPT
jgi:hypothetical protein